MDRERSLVGCRLWGRRDRTSDLAATAAAELIKTAYKFIFLCYHHQCWTVHSLPNTFIIILFDICKADEINAEAIVICFNFIIKKRDRFKQFAQDYVDKLITEKTNFYLSSTSFLLNHTSCKIKIFKENLTSVTACKKFYMNKKYKGKYNYLPSDRCKAANKHGGKTSLD